MAKVTGPLLSMDATGSVAGAFTFTKWKGRNVVRQKVTPANPQTPAQTAVRVMFAGLVAAYQADPIAIKGAFANRAAQNSISEFNAFVGFNQSRVAAGVFPANTTTPTDAAPANNVTELAAIATARYVSLGWTDALALDAWMFAIYRKLGAAPTGVKAELVGVVKRGVELFEDGPLDAGTWYYAVRAISTNGGATAISAVEEIVVA